MNVTFVVIGVAVVVLALLVLLATRYTAKQKNFDEMQLMKRADAYRAGFFTMLGCMLLMMLLVNWKTWTDNVTMLFTINAAIMITLAVFGVYCVMNNAFFGKSDHPVDNQKVYLVLCIAVVLPNCVTAWRHLHDNGTLLENGMVSMKPCGNLMIAGAFFVIAITIVIRMLLDRREEKE